MTLILASRSASRRAMLEAALVPFEPMVSGVDEDAVKAALLADGISPRDLADALAELKAMRLSLRFPDALVLGCDSTVADADGALVDKAESLSQQQELLKKLRGTTHRLWSAAVLCQAGRPVWRFVDGARLTMRDFSDGFLDQYLAAEWPAIGACVGGYRIERMGAQLFARIEGSQYTIQGLPLLPLLDQLRERKVLRA